MLPSKRSSLRRRRNPRLPRTTVSPAPRMRNEEPTRPGLTRCQRGCLPRARKARTAPVATWRTRRSSRRRRRKRWACSRCLCCVSTVGVAASLLHLEFLFREMKRVSSSPIDDRGRLSSCREKTPQVWYVARVHLYPPQTAVEAEERSCGTSHAPSNLKSRPDMKYMFVSACPPCFPPAPVPSSSVLLCSTTKR